MNYEDAPVSLRTAPPSECYFDSSILTYVYIHNKYVYLLTYFVVLDASGGSAIVENLNSQEQRLKRVYLMNWYSYFVSML